MKKYFLSSRSRRLRQKFFFANKTDLLQRAFVLITAFALNFIMFLISNQTLLFYVN